MTDKKERETVRPQIGDIRRDLNEVRELLGLVLNKLTLLELSELTYEARTHNHDIELRALADADRDLSARVAELELRHPPTAAE